MTEKIGPLRIEALANGGAGLGRDDGRVVFVPRTVPGDLISCRPLKVKKRFVEAELLEIHEAAPTRREYPCPVAHECGGCQWQQLPYPLQTAWKERLFHETLLRQCGVAAESLRPLVPAPNEWGYRSRVQVKCYRAPGGFVTGFFRPRSRYVVPFERCPVMAPELNDLLVLLRPVIAESGFAAEIPQLDLALDDAGHRSVVVHYLGSSGDRLSQLLIPLAQRHQFALALQQGRKDSLRLLTGEGELSLCVDEPAIELKYKAGGFAQINLAQNRHLVTAVLGAAMLQGGERILELYCGMGNFSLPLARRAGHVVGVEDFKPSIVMARRNARANRLTNLEFHARPAEGAIAALGGAHNYDLLLLDPPRSGAVAVMKELASSPIQRLLYVSCDPQTLARDLKVLLAAGYRLISSQPIDMFPQTFHVESLTALEFRG